MRSAWVAAIACAACGGSTAADTVDAGGDDAAREDAAIEAGEDATAEAATDAAPGAACGGRGGLACPPDQYCDYPRDDCGYADGTGTCRPRPGFCPGLTAPTCGCDGHVHVNGCAAHVDGTDGNASGCAPAETPAGYIPCGAIYCDVATSYCRRSVSDVAGEPDGWDCPALPPGCSSATADCASCFAGGPPCGGSCEIVLGGGTDGFRVTCPGG